MLWFSVLQNITSQWIVAYKWEGTQAPTFQEDVMLHHAGWPADASSHCPWSNDSLS